MTDIRQASIPVPRRQRGAALITSLVLLLVMTILGLTTTRTSILEERMATNARFRDRAFNSAESVVATTFRQGEYGDAIGDADGIEVVDDPVDADSGDPFAETSSIHYLQITAPCEGSSMGVGQNGGSLQRHFFEIQAASSLKSGSTTLAQSNIVAGVALCAP